MIANITSGSSFYGMVNYHVEKVFKGEAEFIGTNNLISENPQMWARAIGFSAQDNTRCINPTFHVSLNLAPGENVTDDKFMELGKEYMEMMGYGDQPYVVFRHKDKKHEHIHIVSSRIGQDGKKIADFKEHRRSVEATEKLEKKHGLTIVDRSKKEKKLRLFDVEKIKNNPSKVKNHIANIIDDALKKYSLTDINEFKKALSIHQIGVEKLNGISKKGQWEGIVFYLRDKEGNRISKSIPASKIHFKPTLKNLEKYFEKSKPKKKKLKKETVQKVSSVLKSINVLP